MEYVKKYLQEILGINVQIRQVTPKRAGELPLFIRQIYDFYSMTLFGRKILLLKKHSDATISVAQMQKHTQLAEETFDLPAVLVLPFLESYNRKRLIQKRVAFIVPGKQLFIPQLFIDLREFGLAAPIKKEKLSPAAQCLLLYHLLKEDIRKYSLKEIAVRLNYTQATVTRAVQILVDKKLAEKSTSNKEARIKFVKEGRNLWLKALPLLQNPVKKVYFLERLPRFKFVYRASFSALADYTDLAEDNKKYFALSQGDFDMLKRERKIKIVNSEEAPIHLQVWKYSPALLSKGKNVDPLSLYLSLKDVEEERVQKMLSALVKQVW